MRFEDEPAPGEPFRILPGHFSTGRFERVLRAGKFAVSAELSPPDSADPEEVYSRARVFDGYVDAINATDGSGANCHMSSVGVCALLTRKGYSTVMQVSCRDRNRLAIQGDVLGAAHPMAKPVFDLDAVSLVSTVKMMRDEGHFQSGRRLTTPPRLFIGAADNPFVPPLEYRVDRLAKKIAAGAQFIQTQYCFDVPRLKEYMTRVRDLGLHEKAFVIVGTGPLASANAARWIRDHVPGIDIPDAVIKRLEGVTKPRLEGRKLCMEIIQEIRQVEGVSGVHVMAYRQEESVAELVDASGVLEGRVPWYPGLIENTNVKRAAG
jgi:methylenetetrahydrofolate reductase (NADPH)